MATDVGSLAASGGDWSANGVPLVLWAGEFTPDLTWLGAGGCVASLEEAIEASSQRLEHWLIAEQSTPSGPVRQAEEILEMARALDELPSFQREAIVMFYWQGCSLAEIGEIMGCSGPAVAGLLHRGLKRLRERLAEPE